MGFQREISDKCNSGGQNVPSRRLDKARLLSMIEQTINILICNIEKTPGPHKKDIKVVLDGVIMSSVKGHYGTTDGCGTDLSSHSV